MAKSFAKEQIVPTQKLAEDLAKILGCSGSHRVGNDGWGPCESSTDLLKLIEVGNPAFSEWKKRQQGKTSVSKKVHRRCESPSRSISFVEAKADVSRSDSFKPTDGMVTEAERGLAWRREFGRGGTGVGISRARDIVNGRMLPYATVKRMKAFFDRHQVDAQGQGFRKDEKGYPSNGRIAWALWGGDAGYAWSKAIVERVERNAKMAAIVENSYNSGVSAISSIGVQALSELVESKDDFSVVVGASSTLSNADIKVLSRLNFPANPLSKCVSHNRTFL